jgi:integrase
VPWLTSIRDAAENQASAVTSSAFPLHLRHIPDAHRATASRELNLAPLNPRTINSYLASFRSLFENERKARRIGKNPFEEMAVPVASRTNGERGFKTDEITTIFSSPLFQWAKSSSRPYDRGGLLIDDWRFWAPVIAFFSGMRVAEIAQLRPADVREQGGIWAFDVSTDGGRRLKTTASTRLVPVHPRLIELGLLALAAEGRERGRARLLPEIPKPVGEDAGKQPSRWMSEKFLPRLGLSTRAGLGFHSFRHGMATMLRDAGVEDRLCDRILGHAARSVGASYGQFSLPLLHSALSSIAVPEVMSTIPPRTARSAAST